MKSLIPQPSQATVSRIWRSCRAGLWALCVVAALSISAQAQVTGAIFTTDNNCEKVNGNIYCSKTDVYLNGGPDHPKAAGLPDGDYYIKVTEPDGTPLGQSVGTYEVVAGKFVACINLFVATGFKDTTNPGGEYKAWVSKNPEFPPSESKTDNFKVKCTSKCQNPCVSECLVVALNPKEICATKLDATITATLLSEGNGAVTYTWYIDGLKVEGEEGATITINPTPGEHTYKVVATDPSHENCTDSAEAQVIVYDGEDCDRAGCEVKCPANVEVECGASTLPADTGSAECTGGCAPTFVDVEEAGCGGTKTIKRSWYCTEEATGLYSKCVQVISIVDTTVPTISCPAAVEVQCMGDVPPPDISLVIATDTCSGPATVEWVGDESAGPVCNRVITRTYKATDACGKAAICTQKIYVKDTIAPVITKCPGVVKVQCVGDVPPPDIGLVEGTDNCGGAVTITWVCDEATGPDCDKLITRIYKAADACGNFALCKQKICVKDTLGPTITPVQVAAQCYDPANPWRKILVTPPTVTDNCSSGLTATPSGIPAGDLYPLGTTTITWTAKDVCGNETKVTQDVTVKVCTCALVNGLSKGYWGNKNGCQTLKNNDPKWRTCLNTLNLKNGNGTAFTVATVGSFDSAYTPFNTWLQGATAVNMANMLSAQLAAVKLDVSFASPLLNGNNLLFIPSSLKTGAGANVAATLLANGATGLLTDIQGNGYISINNLILSAVAELGKAGHNLSTASGPIRTYQEALKDLLDAVCNNAIKTVCP